MSDPTDGAPSNGGSAPTKILPDRIGSFAQLIALAEHDQVPHMVDHERQVLQVPTRSGALDGTMFVRWEKTLPYCQAIQPMLMDVPADRVAAVESAIGRINHAIALPGFGYDHEKRFIYFRICIPIEPGGMAATFLRLMLRACVNNARDFIGALRGVVHGEPAENVLKTAVDEALRAQAAQAAAAFQD